MKIAVVRQGGGFTHPDHAFGGGETQQNETIRELLELGVPVSFDPNEAEIVHFFNIFGSTLSEIKRCKVQGKRVVLATIYWPWDSMPWPRQRREDYDRLCAEAMSAADVLCPNSVTEAQVIHERFGIPMEKITPVVNGVPLDICRCAEGSWLDPEATCGLKDYVLIVGRTERRKNQAAFIRAMRDVPLPIVCIGETHEIDYFWGCWESGQARRYPTVFLPGIAPPMIYQYMVHARVVAQPSLFETPGLACLEAAALGVPVAPTSVGSTREYFGPETYYIDPASAASMAGCLEAANRPRRAAQERILAKFTWRRAAEQTLAIYRRLGYDG